MSFILIRHGKTQGNLEGRYIGSRTEESLCAAGCEQLKGRNYPPVKAVFASPMKRCLETAALIYPGVPVTAADGLKECDFGAFENLNYSELNGRSDYQAWIDSGGEMPFPGGESRREFARRCVRAFTEIISGLDEGDYAFIVHGGTIMAVMETMGVPAAGYYDYQVKNGEGYILERDGQYKKLL